MSELGLFAAAPVGIARVALPVPVDRLFDYSVPAHLVSEARPGRRVRVRFDRRELTGVVVELAGEPRPEARHRLRALEAVLDAEPVLTPEWMGILREEAAAVLCPVGLALATALPPGAAPRARPGVALTARGRAALGAGAVTGTARALLAALAEAPGGRAERSALLRGAGDAAAALDALLADGLAAAVSVVLAPRARRRRERTAAPAPGLDREAALAELARAPRQAEVLRAVAEAGECATAELAARVPRAADALRALERRGFVVLGERDAPRDVLGPAGEADARVSLTPEQARACAALAECVRDRRAARFLLHGVTGSGKTEVYLRTIAEALAAGRQALVLVPEITLTHQILARLRARFGDALAVLHSGLSPGARLEQWERLRDGETPIAVGARSALFAPLHDLGVIVVDEEHDSAYKNDEGFRYHARDLAGRRARAAGCPLVLGTATPALETRFACERGEIERLVLSHRIGGRPLPAVQIVDLAAERARLPRGRKLILSRALRRALAEVLRDGGQSLLFLNRRGFSTSITCFSCGYVEHCKHCDIALVYHAAEDRLRCHYCDHRALPPEACPQCGSPENALLGVGTQRLEEEVRGELPDARVVRLDRDVAGRRGATRQILDDLRAGRIDVLVGTQIVAKGHDFPGVRLVGVVNADIGLHLPDFRAAERTFQLLTQVAGRAGRGGAPGRVVVQTFLPDHYAVRPVVDHDYERFYREELANRRALGYPPCGFLARTVVSGPEEPATREAAGGLAAGVRGMADVEVLGPAPAPLARLRGRHRFQLVVKSGDTSAVHAAAARLVDAAARLPAPLRASVDANPYDML